MEMSGNTWYGHDSTLCAGGSEEAKKVCTRGNGDEITADTQAFNALSLRHGKSPFSRVVIPSHDVPHHEFA